MTSSQIIPRGRRLAAAAGLMASAMAIAGCNTDDLVAVETPDVIQPGAVQTVSALPSVFNAAVGDFGVAFQGSSGTEGQVLYSGLLSDELLLSDTFDTRRQVDRRSIFRENSNNEAVYRQLQRARAAAERSADAYLRLQPNTASQAEALALAGFTYVFFAEDYCGAVPFSSIDANGQQVFGVPETTQQILARAEAKFDSALTIASLSAVNSAALQNLARVGKARVQVNQGRYADAAATVAAVPTTFSYTTFSSDNSARQNNGVFSWNRNQRRFSVAAGEGTNGLVYRSTRTTQGDATVDPRVLVVRGNGTTANGFDATPLYVAVRYSEFTSSTVLASGVEARLIEAEAALNANNYAAALATLNTLRANGQLFTCPNTGVTLTNFGCPTSPRTLAALTDPGTSAGRVQQLFSERAFWLYLTSHRLGDMRRLARGSANTANAAGGLSAYGLGANAVFPVGNYVPFAGTTYGDNTSLPVPFSEESNPNYKGAQCDVVNP